MEEGLSWCKEHSGISPLHALNLLGSRTCEFVFTLSGHVDTQLCIGYTDVVDLGHLAMVGWVIKEVGSIA